MKMTDKVYSLVSDGVPFRDAYSLVKNSDDHSALLDETKSLNHSMGSPGNLNLNLLEKRLKKQK
jgi:hypothetical protein